MDNSCWEKNRYVVKISDEIQVWGKYQDGKMTGVWELVNVHTGVTIQAATYINGKKHGHYFRRHEDFDGPEIEGEYENDKKTGKWTWWNYGSKWKEGEYRDDLQEGVWKELSLNGEKMALTIGEYRNGKKEGKWVTWQNVLYLDCKIDDDDQKQEKIYVNDNLIKD